MKIVLISYGSRGDVQPYLALARALRHVGHEARLVAPPTFAALAGEYGVPFFPAGVDLQAHPATLKPKESDRRENPIATLRRLRDHVRSIFDAAARDSWAACQGSELVIGVGATADSVAEKLGVPFVEAALQPVTPTRAFPSPVVAPGLRLGGAANYATHVVFEQAFWQVFRAMTNHMRTKVLDLPPYGLASQTRRISERALLRLFGYSAHVVPRPADWPAHHQVTGYWFLPPPADWQPPEDLRAFLEGGPPPVYVGFGSMTGRDPERMTELVIAALRRSGRRGLLAGGWGALAAGADPGADMFFAGSLPHDWLFPRMAAIVHHAGAGTAGAALRSGTPSLAVPFGFDQPFWGQRIAALGAGPRPIPRSRLTVDNLAAAIEEAAGDPGMRERAARLGELIRQEHGTAQAVDRIHRALGERSISLGLPGPGR